jgi:hypothetical protein
MTDSSRRAFLRGTAVVGLGAVAAPALSTASAWAGVSPTFAPSPATTSSPAPSQLHVQFGTDAARQANISWATDGTVRRPQLRLGTPHGGYGQVIPAETRTYVDSINNVETYTQHAHIDGLFPDTDYVFEATHQGAAAPVTGTFRTAPTGRVPFRFTSFGDLATPNTAWSKSSLNAATAVDQVEAFNPLFHLLNGDLSYANVNQTNQPGCWADYMDNMQNSAKNRAWMTALGNHEVEAGNGETGYNSYLTRFDLPDNGSRDYQGRWYSFQVGSALFVALDANDVVFQNDGGAFYDTSTGLYITGYSNGAQVRWLRGTLAAARADRGIDWIIVFYHQPGVSSSSSGSGCDGGVREQFMTLFDEYGVDLVLTGHDHDYERSYPVRGTDAGTFLRPTVVSTDLKTADTSKGTVHLVLGGGGTSSHDDVYTLSEPSDVPVAQVYTKPSTSYKADADSSELATWSAVRDPDTTHPWGIAVFDLDPGRFPGDQTSITMSYYHTPAATAASPDPAPVLLDGFTAVRRRSDRF